MLSRIIAPSVAIMLLSSTAASAASFTFTDITTGFADNAGIIQGPGFSGQDAPWTTPIFLTTATGETFETYCDDLFHNITISGQQNLTYVTGLVTTNGSGGVLSEATSNIMGQITRIGLDAFAAGNFDLAIAAQGADWQLEDYGPGPVTSPNAVVEGDILTLLETVHNNGTGYAHGLISLQGDQDQILASPAVPEPSTWAMMLLGFIGLGYAARRKRSAISTYA
jgi:PEP-CTERM motif